MIRDEPTTKICSKCGEEKTLDMFNKHSGCKYGVRSNCIICQSIQGRKYTRENNKEINERRAIHRDKNKDKLLQQSRAYYSKNKVKINERGKIHSKNYRERNPEKRKEICKRYRENNREAVRIGGLRYYHDNSEMINEKIKERLKNDHTYRIRNQILSCFYNVKRKKLDKDFDLYFHDVCGDIQLYIDHFKNSKEWDDYIKDVPLDLDHIVPVSAYDLKDLDEIKKCWDKQNLRLLPQKENGIKHNKIYFDLIEQHGISHLLPKGLKNSS